MKRTKAQRVLAAACGPALGVLLAVPLGGLVAGAAGADTCYTGCTSPTTGIATTPAVTTATDGVVRRTPTSRAGSRSRVPTSKRWRSSASWRSVWVPFSFAVAGGPPEPLHTLGEGATRMSSVTIGRDLQSWRWGRPDSESGPLALACAAGSRPAPAVEVVAGTDLLILAVAVAAFAPAVLQWPVAVFVVGVLGVCAVRGQYASRISLNVSKDIGTLAAAVAVPLTVIGAFDGFGRQVAAVRAGGTLHAVPAPHRPGLRLRRHPAGPDQGSTRTTGAHRGSRTGGGALRRCPRTEPELRAAPDRAAGRLRRRVTLTPGARWDRPARRRPAGSPHRSGGASPSA